MHTAILKTSGLGQISFPQKWNLAERYCATKTGVKIILEPCQAKNDRRWKTVFDCEEAGLPEGVELKNFLRALKNSLKNSNG
jgi:hypothetical protein